MGDLGLVLDPCLGVTLSWLPASGMNLIGASVGDLGLVLGPHLGVTSSWLPPSGINLIGASVGDLGLGLDPRLGMTSSWLPVSMSPRLYSGSSSGRCLVHLCGSLDISASGQASARLVDISAGVELTIVQPGNWEAALLSTSDLQWWWEAGVYKGQELETLDIASIHYCNVQSK